LKWNNILIKNSSSKNMYQQPDFLKKISWKSQPYQMSDFNGYSMVEKIEGKNSEEYKNVKYNRDKVVNIWRSDSLFDDPPVYETPYLCYKRKDVDNGWKKIHNDIMSPIGKVIRNMK